MAELIIARVEASLIFLAALSPVLAASLGTLENFAVLQETVYTFGLQPENGFPG